MLAKIFSRVGVALFVTAFLSVAGLSIWYGGSAARSDVLSLQARWQIDQWRSSKGTGLTLAKWNETRKKLQEALRLTSKNAQLHDDLAYLYAARALGMGAPEERTKEHAARQSLLNNAIVNYQISTELRPTFPYSWAYLALSQQQAGQGLSVVMTAFDKAYKYGSTEPDVRMVLAKIAFNNWHELAEDRRENVVKMFHHSSTDVKKSIKKMASEKGIEINLN